MNSLFLSTPTWNSFWYAIKEQYYPVRSCEGEYIKWATLRQGRDLKYDDFLHKYIHDEMEFLDISSLVTTYQYDVKIEEKFKQKK